MQEATSVRLDALGPGSHDAVLATTATAAPPADGPILTAAGQDNTIRWRQDERFEHIFEERCDRLRGTGRAGHLAVDAGDETLTFDELDARANRLARYLHSCDVRPGDRVALLLDEPVQAYVGMLAALKAGCAYVPLDVGFPSDRISYIVDDAKVRAVLSLAHLRDRLADVRIVCLDDEAEQISTCSGDRLARSDRDAPPDDLCYIIYTSGSTGRPKGVAVGHASICNFVRVAAEVYGFGPEDRVYQGMTIAFDFSVEEIWVPLAVGATLVPKPAGAVLLGPDLRDFIQRSRITALCCVPTLLATLDEDLPDLRFLLVSGEACPQYLITRWGRGGRRMLNVYGPTEATVTATWAVVDPDKPVTLGVPLPTYSVVILDPEGPRALPAGEMGEIGIAGVGLAKGYVNRDDLTDRAFIPDFLGAPNNPSGRIYRTGDLGRVNTDGEIEYHGRIDTQVKIRGYRIELAEIESVLLQLPGISQAVVDAYEPEPGVAELVAYYSVRENGHRVEADEINGHLRDRLPGYMVPAYYEQLAAIPMLPSDKADRKSLPPPSGPRLLGAADFVAPETSDETVMAEELAAVLGLERVSVTSRFFDDLGASSLLMARFCARLRERDVPSLSMKDIYVQPTIRNLAALRAAPAATAVGEQTVAPPLTRARTRQYVTCGALQFLAFLGYAYVSSLVVVWSLRWVVGASGFADTYVRSVVLGSTTFVYFCAAPIVLKWIVIGRWKSCEIPIWSLGYLRFWMVKTAIRANPLALFVGSPVYAMYLRALGAKIGRGAVILTTMPVCTDLLSIGAGAVIRKDSFLPCYRGHAGLIQTGAVRIGANAFVGEKTVLDIDTSIGDGAQLGHTSALVRGQSVPDGEHWHGSPAQKTDLDYRTVAPARCGTFRRAAYGTLQIVMPLIFYVPIGFGILSGLLERFIGSPWVSVTEGDSIERLVAGSFVMYFGLVLTGLIFVATVPRLLNLALKPGRVYRLYGIRYVVQRAVTRMTNAKFYVDLFGDSACIPHYLRYIGYKLGRIEQTGSNFGTELGHESPYLSSVGRGTMVSDALSIMNAEYSSTSFQLSPVEIGPRNFLGNNIAYPPRAKVGENCLLGTKVMIPLDGQVRANVGLLGSPSFEIPRSVASDGRFDHLSHGDELIRRLAAKRRYNTATMGLFLLVRWFRFMIAVLILAATIKYFGPLSVVFSTLSLLVFGILYGVFIERLATGFRALSPRFCSIYQRYFWWHERVWKLLATPLFNGTPFKNVMWRMLGVRIGRRVFDDGCGIPEKTLVTIGDDCTLNAGSVVQCHSLEDGTFKSDRTVIGSGCTVGLESFIHYGVTMGDGAVLAPDAFLMKGEQMPPSACWQGNPARAVHRVTSEDLA
jgi:non-ribosomal peptide synthetase-like protein